MNLHERRRKATTGETLIEETIADILKEARYNNEGGLTIEEVRKRTGSSTLHYQACQGFLHQMRDLREVVNDTPGQGPGNWRLVD